MKNLLVAATLMACTGLNALGAAPITVGAIIAITGNSAVQGQSIRDGIVLAVEEVNKRGGINGSKIELIVEDSKTDAQTAMDCFTRLEATKRPLFYITHLGAVATALAPLAEQNRVVLEAISTTLIGLTREREWVFRYWCLTQTYIPPLLGVLQSSKTKKLGIIYMNDANGKENQQLMSNAFSETGGIVTSEMVEVKDTDFSSKIAALMSQEAIYVPCTGTILLGVLRQLKEAGYKGKVLSNASAAQPSVFGLPEADGVYVAAPIIFNPGFLYAKDAGERFFARYNRPFDQLAANGYDVIKLITGLLEDRQVSRQSMRDLLAGGFQYAGVFGQVRAKPGEHELIIQMYATQVVNGSLKYR
jgi:branched-chain amino acid transport system substrate-binding protein